MRAGGVDAVAHSISPNLGHFLEINSDNATEFRKNTIGQKLSKRVLIIQRLTLLIFRVSQRQMELDFNFLFFTYNALPMGLI